MFRGKHHDEQKEYSRERLLTYAFNALAAKPYTEKELRLRLEKRSVNEEDIFFVLERVKELGYQKDSDVANLEMRRKGRGKLRIAKTLQHRGVSREIIKETLDDIDPEEEYKEALELLEKRWPSLQKTKNPRGNAYGLLARRGYESGLIWRAIETITGQRQEDECQDE